jgi:hypothetical protein
MANPNISPNLAECRIPSDPGYPGLGRGAVRPGTPKRRVSRLDLDQGVQDHRPTLVGIDHIGVHAWALLIVRIQAVNLERLGTRRTVGFRPVLAGPDPGIGREAELHHLTTDVGHLDFWKPDGRR